MANLAIQTARAENNHHLGVGRRTELVKWWKSDTEEDLTEDYPRAEGNVTQGQSPHPQLTHGGFSGQLAMILGALSHHLLKLTNAVLGGLPDKGLRTPLREDGGWPNGLGAAVLEGCGAAGLVGGHGLPILPQESHLEGQLGYRVRTQPLLL